MKEALRELTVQGSGGYAGSMTDIHIEGEPRSRGQELDSAKQALLKQVQQEFATTERARAREQLTKESRQQEETLTVALGIPHEQKEVKTTEKEEEEEKKKKEGFFAQFFNGLLPKNLLVSKQVDQFYEDITRKYGQGKTIADVTPKELQGAYLKLRKTAENVGEDTAFLAPIRAEVITKGKISSDDLDAMYLQFDKTVEQAIIHPAFTAYTDKYEKKVAQRPLAQWTAQEIEQEILTWDATVMSMHAQTGTSVYLQQQFWHDAKKHAYELAVVYQAKGGNIKVLEEEKQLQLGKAVETAEAVLQKETNVVQFPVQRTQTEQVAYAATGTEDRPVSVQPRLSTATREESPIDFVKEKQQRDDSLQARYQEAARKVQENTDVEEVKKNARLSDTQRVVRTRETLDELAKDLGVEPQALTPQQERAIIKAHDVGKGEMGKDETSKAGVYNYKLEHIREKNRILQEAGFSKKQIRALMEKGIVGNGGGVLPTEAQIRASLGITPEQFKSPEIQAYIRDIVARVPNPTGELWVEWARDIGNMQNVRPEDKRAFQAFAYTKANEAFQGRAGALRQRQQEYAAENEDIPEATDIMQDPIQEAAEQATRRARQQAQSSSRPKRGGKDAIPIEFVEGGDAESQTETVYQKIPEGMPDELIENVWDYYARQVAITFGREELNDEEKAKKAERKELPLLTKQEDAVYDKMLAVLNTAKSYEDLKKLLMRGEEKGKIGVFLRSRAFRQKKTTQVEGRINAFLEDKPDPKEPDKRPFSGTKNFRKAKEYVRRMLVDSLREKNNRMATSIQDVAKGMAEKDPQKWGKGKSHAILNVDNSINKANFLKWIQEEMTDLDGLSPDDPVQFFNEVHIESGMYSSRLSFQEMYLRPGRYFYDEKSGEKLEDLWDEAMHQVWLLGKARNWNILHKRAMGNDEKLPGAMVEQSYDNAFTKDVGGMNTLHRILSMAQESLDPYKDEDLPENEKHRAGERKDQKLGQAVRRAVLTYYHISDFDRLRQIHGDGSAFFAKNYTRAAIKRLEDEKVDAEKRYNKQQEDPNFPDEEKITKEQLEEQQQVLEEQIKSIEEKVERKQKGTFHQYKFVLKDDMFANDQLIFTKANQDKFVKEFNIFQNANPKYDNQIELRDRIKASLIEQHGLSQEEADYAELWAFSMTHWTGIAARNDIAGTGYDAWAKLQNLKEYRWRQSQGSRGAPYGNPYNWAAIKKLDTTLFEAIRTNDGRSLLEVIEGRRKDNNGAMDLDDHIQDMHFPVDKSKKWGDDHINYIFGAYRKIIRHEDMNFDTFTQWDPFRGVIIDYKKAEEVMGGIIKDLRYAFSTWDGVDFTKKTRVAERVGMKDGRPVFEYRECTLAEAFFGPEILDDYYERDGAGDYIRNSEGRPVINFDKLKVDADEKLIWKKLFRYQVASELRSRRDWNGPYKRYSFAETERIIEWLERMPGEIAGSDEDMKETHWVERFFSKEDIEWIRKHSHTEELRMFLHEAGYEVGVGLLKGIVSETDKLGKYIFG